MTSPYTLLSNLDRHIFLLLNETQEFSLANLPVIVGFGGINAAGRSSFHHGYRRLVIDAIDRQHAEVTFQNLARLMGLADQPLDSSLQQTILDGTLVRKIDDSIFDPNKISFNARLNIQQQNGDEVSFELPLKNLPQKIPDNWRINTLDEKRVLVHASGPQDFFVPSQRALKVQSAGQLPKGFDPGADYNSHNHPRGLQMTVFGASDALGSVGIDWADLSQHVSADQISVYAGSGMSQLDAQSNGGMMSARFNDRRVSAKQCPFGFAEMPADFINAYILGSLGTTGTSMGACASFLYNLRQAMTDIQSGRSQIAIVGNSEAPIIPEIIEGYAAMSALASDKDLAQLDGGTIDYRRACRPFGDNCGFTLAESAQFIVLFDDTLAVELGATIHGAVSDVFINADGYKKSISAPGVGNYLTVAKAMAGARGLVGESALRHRSFVQAHGTGTPQNRVTESAILDQAAKVFGIESWPVVAVKSYLGHSIGAAGADQLITALGVWNEGILPGINTIDKPADDVACEHLKIGPEHQSVGKENLDVAIINAKGFGGNNASATLLAPHITARILASKHKGKLWSQYSAKSEAVMQQAQAYDQAMLNGTAKPIYRFDNNVLDGHCIDFNDKEIRIPGYNKAINLDMQSEFKQWLD